MEIVCAVTCARIVATLLGSYAIVKENEWSMLIDKNKKNSNDIKRNSRLSSILVLDKRDGRNWDMMYTLKSIAVGAAMAFISTRVTV
eukprot:scaffold654_cov148-Skeletonema_menzelii.AAC.13